jgi:hypothetical protein
MCQRTYSLIIFQEVSTIACNISRDCKESSLNTSEIKQMLCMVYSTAHELQPFVLFVAQSCDSLYLFLRRVTTLFDAVLSLVLC